MVPLKLHDSVRTSAANAAKYAFFQNRKPTSASLILTFGICIAAFLFFMYAVAGTFSFLALIAAITFSILYQGIVIGNIYAVLLFVCTELFFRTTLFYPLPARYLSDFQTKIPVFVFYFWGLSIIIMYQIQKFRYLTDNYRTELEERIQAGTKQLSNISLDVINSLFDAYVLKNPTAKNHSMNVAYLSEQIARKVTPDPQFVKKAYYAGLLHNVGKIRFSDEFTTVETFSPEEYGYYTSHTVFGAELLEKLSLQDIADAVRYHHEKMDGSGFPEGLRGDDIPFLAQIVGLANTTENLLAAQTPEPEMTLLLKRKAGVEYPEHLVAVILDILL